jgi:hypothetical protein
MQGYPNVGAMRRVPLAITIIIIHAKAMVRIALCKDSVDRLLRPT